MSAYYQHVLMLTGLTGILAAIPCVWLYRGDFVRRRETGILQAAVAKTTLKAESEAISEKMNGGVRRVGKIFATGRRLRIPPAKPVQGRKRYAPTRCVPSFWPFSAASA